MTRIFALPLIGLALLGATSALAQESVLEKAYGQGVHAYNAGDVAGAEQSLTEAIKGGSKDPRAYYYRALTMMRMGRTDEAQADLRRGAEMEAADVAGIYPVSRSIERVQGQQRIAVEKYRAQAKMIAYQRAEASRKARYEQQAQLDKEAISRQGTRTAPRSAGSLPEPSKKSGPSGDAGPDPFGEPETTAGSKKGEAFATPDVSGDAPAKDASKPAGDAKPEKMPADAGGADPFGAPVTPPASPATGADPFGAPATPPATPATGADPFGAPATPPATPAAGADPFGAPATPPVTPPATPAAGADPFGAPATPPATVPAAMPAAPAAGGPATSPAAPAPAGKAGMVGGLMKAFSKATFDDGAAPATPGTALPFPDAPVVITPVAPAAAVPAAPTAPAPVPPAAVAPATPAADDPFGAPAAKPEMKTPTAAPTVDDPFGAPAIPAAKPPAAKPAGGDPFGDDPAAPKPAMKAPPKAADDDPFGK